MTNSTRDGSDLTNPAMMPWPDFLMLVPPGETRGVLNYSQKPSLRGTLRGPDLMLECSVCNGARMFACPEDGDRFGLDEDGSFESYLSYHCKNCERGKKTYAVHIHFREAKAWATKYGEWPAFGGRLSSAFLDQFDDAEKALLPKGRQCENHGLGVGAFAYYRRVVEMHKNKLFDQIIEAVRSSDDDTALIEQFEQAKAEKRFTASVDKLRGRFPGVLKLDGSNPLTLLYGVLSESLHDEGPDDEKCLQLASDVLRTLRRLSRRIDAIRQDEGEGKLAIQRLEKHRAEKDAGEETGS